MQWTSTLKAPTGRRSSAEALLVSGAEDIAGQLGGHKPDLLIGFVAPHFFDEFERVPAVLMQELRPRCFVGCTAGGLIGGWQEIEQEPAIALTAAVLPEVAVRAFHIGDAELPDLDDPPERWEERVGVSARKKPSFILLPDPFTIRVDVLVEGLDFAFPGSIKVGGLASGASQPGINALFLNGEILRAGAVGVAPAGNIVVDTVVAQGCRPIGRPMHVTRCQKHIVYELDDVPAVSALHRVLVDLSGKDRDLARHSLFLGVAMSEFKDELKPGDFLIRNILGVDPDSGALAVGEVMHEGRTVQFHLRDAATSADDLRLLLKHYVQTHERNAAGALLFSCLGRGRYLYGMPNHDTDCFREYVGEVPLGGFFCNGEIGPVGGCTFLHGYTSSFGIFREREPARA